MSAPKRASLIAASMILMTAAMPACAAPKVTKHVNVTVDARSTNAVKRMAWWHQAKFGMFIHWGLYAVPAGTYDGKQIPSIGEWIMNTGKIPVATYADYAKKFNPTKFDADTWVSIAKAAGMKYIVMTAKHHDGFGMYHSEVDPYNIYDATQFKRDPIAEMAAACKKQGIRFGVYYSQSQDWHHPGGGAFGGHWDTAQDGDYDKYLANIALPQVKELVTRYKPSVVWFDTPVDMTPERAAPFVDIFEQHPDIIVNNRLGGGFAGDTETPEQNIPPTGFPGRDWETCMTINDTWGYKSYDTNFKSTETLLTNLIDIASKGGNYLLNVGPDATGVIPQPEVDRLAEVGKWLKVNGEAVYGTTVSPFRKLPFEGRCISKGSSLYLAVFHWPSGGLTLPYVHTELKRATALAGGQKLTASTAADGTISIEQPAVIDPIATVVKLEFVSKPEVVVPVVYASPGADGAYHLGAADADLHGGVQVEHDPANVGYWTDSNSTVTWNVDVPADGQYTVGVTYACDNGSAGSTYKVGLDDGASVEGKVDGTGNWGDYKTVTLDGKVTLTVGRHLLRVTPTSMPHGAVMNLREVTFTPTTVD